MKGERFQTGEREKNEKEDQNVKEKMGGKFKKRGQKLGNHQTVSLETKRHHLKGLYTH